VDVKPFIAAFLLLTACNHKEPQEVKGTSNPTIKAELLFKYDGCKVYRFRDGDYHYFVKCDGGESRTTDYKNCGEDCQKLEEIPTVRVKP
jgi:hypothetical protein